MEAPRFQRATLGLSVLPPSRVRRSEPYADSNLRDPNRSHPEFDVRHAVPPLHSLRVPISGYIESFLNETMTAETDIEEVPRLLIDYFQKTPEIPAAGFHVAGYRKVNGQLQQRIWRCFPVDKGIQDVVPAIQQQGALWNGEQDVLTRIVNQSIYFHVEDGSHQLLPYHAVPFAMFTLQDMIDFAVYAIRTTADTMRFQVRPKTVGGPIDVLVIKPTEAEWISRKILQVAQ